MGSTFAAGWNVADKNSDCAQQDSNRDERHRVRRTYAEEEADNQPCRSQCAHESGAHSCDYQQCALRHHQVQHVTYREASALRRPVFATGGTGGHRGVHRRPSFDGFTAGAGSGVR